MAKYKDFKTYIQVNYGELIIDSITTFLNKDGCNSTFSQHLLCDQKAKNLEIKTLYCYEDIGNFVIMDIGAAVDVFIESLGGSDALTYYKREWYMCKMRAWIENGMSDVQIIRVDKFYVKEFEKEGALDEFLVPYIYAEDLEDIADDFTAFYCDEDYYNGWNWPIARIMDELGIKRYRASLPSNEFGRMYFRKSVQEVQHIDKSNGRRIMEVREITPGTMLISDRCTFMNFNPIDTVAHEVVHWDKHRLFFEVLALLDDEEMMSCSAKPATTPEGLTGVQKSLWWAEWQANALAPRILMPRKIFDDLFPKLYEEQLTFPYDSLGEVMERTLREIAGVFKVSKYEAKLRALQLGYKDAEGAFLKVNGYAQNPYSFNIESLHKYQTFILNQKNYSILYDENEWFRNLIDEGKFVYTGLNVCINDPLYIVWEEGTDSPKGYKMTPFALDHVDLCCLKFTRHYEIHIGAGDFYDQCYLSKDVNADEFCETRTIEREDNQDVSEQAEQLERLKREGKRITAMLDDMPSSFYKSLDYLIERAKKEDGSKMTNLELEMRTGLNERSIREMRRNANLNPTFHNVAAICIGLHLHPMLSGALIMKGPGFPNGEERFFAEYILGHHYMDSLELCNEKITAQGFRPWGKEEKILS